MRLQVLNICSGDMSLVGPRPEVQQYVDLYSEGRARSDGSPRVDGLGEPVE